MSLKRTGPTKGDRPALRMALHVSNCTGQVQGVPFDVSRQRFFWLDDGPLIPPGNSCIKSRGLSSKNRLILYRGFPLWLGFTGEGCDSIEVSGCQTRAWRSTFYIKASLVHMVLFLFYIDFHFMLDSSQGLGFNLCTMPKCTLKIKPLFRFFHCEAWGS